MLQLNNISFKYNNQKSEKVFVFDKLNLKINKNEFTSIVGPSGCGKSTLINLVAGYFPLLSGEILLNDQKVIKPGRDRIVINQRDDLFDWLTVWENIRIVTKNNKIIEKYLKLLNLEKIKNRYAGELSGGMKKRLSLARALSADGDFILMDEPFSSLDNNIKEKLHIELLSLIKKTDKTFILVTHDVEEALFLSNRIIVLNSDIPTTIEKDLDINFNRIRDLKLKEQKDFFLLKNKILRYYR